MNDKDIDDMEVARCSCGLVFYSLDYALSHVCLGGDEEAEGDIDIVGGLDGFLRLLQERGL